jgi:guanyl-specific ribonuclease Sa
MQTKHNRFGPRRPQTSTTPHLVRLIASLALVLVIMYTAWQRSQDQPQQFEDLNNPPAVKMKRLEPGKTAPPVNDASPDSSAENSLPKVHFEPERVIKTQIANATIRDQDGKVVYRGRIDLSETLARIERNERGSHPNDGSIFQNREKRLPLKPSGYYREWVHPTEGLRGPGPQRIVTGEEGEIYYTPDHYKTFERLDREAGQGRDTGNQGAPE